MADNDQFDSKNLGDYKDELRKIQAQLEGVTKETADTLKLREKEYELLKKINQAYSEYNRLGYKALADLRERAKIEDEIKKDEKALIGYVKQIKSINKDINNIKNKILELQKDDIEENRQIVKLLSTQVKQLEQQRDLIADTIKNTNKWGLGLKVAAKAVVAIGDGIKQGYGMIKGSGLFEMDKAIKNSALSMGILSKQSDAFASQIKEAANSTIQFGVGIEDLANIQSSYSDTMGRTVMLGKEAAESMGAMAKSTGLGAEGAGQMAGDMDTIGYSAGRTADFVEQTMNDAHAMGLNSSKVIKTIAQNIKILNKYNFKGGAKGLARMAEETQKMGVSLEMVAPMADKLFDIEGAVEMSAQLQVLGGKWASLADPFKLMYMARNDMAGLTKEVINATIASSQFNKETGEFDISSLEMQRLRKVAEATGLNFEELAQSAKKAAQYAGIKKQISYGFDDKTEQFIESTSFMDKNGRAKITMDIDGTATTKFLSELNDSDKKLLKQQALDKESMVERAKGNRTFDDALNNTITLFKQMMLPLIDTMNKKLLPKVETFVKNFNEKGGWGEKISEFAKVVGQFVTAIGGWIIDNPIKTGLLYGGSKLVGFLFEKAEWVSNGIALSEGFLMGTGGGGGGMLGNTFKGLKNMLGIGGGRTATSAVGSTATAAEGAAATEETASTMGATMGGTFTSVLKSPMARFGGIAAGLISAIGTFMENSSKGMGTGENFGRSAMTGVGTGVGAFGGMAGGAALGSFAGPIGTLIGGLAGAIFGGMGGGALGNAAGDSIFGKFQSTQQPVDDGIIKFNPRDKFTKVNDATMVAGTNVNGNKDLAAQLAATSGVKPMATQSQMPGTMNINFGQLTLGGTIELKLSGNYSSGFAKELIDNPLFLREITNKIHLETEKNLNAGKPRA